jgi:GAF domain-containing protein
LRFTEAGLSVRAMVDSEAMTSLSGSNPTRIAAGVWVGATFLAGLVGVLNAPIVGLDANKFGTLPPTHPVVRAAILSKRVLVPADPMIEPLNGLPITALIPLTDGDEICGLVILFRMLRQKPVMEPSDLDLLDALGAHAGRALIHARLREQAR